MDWKKCVYIFCILWADILLHIHISSSARKNKTKRVKSPRLGHLRANYALCGWETIGSQLWSCEEERRRGDDGRQLSSDAEWVSISCLLAAGTARFQNFLDARLLESKITYMSASLWSNFLLLCVPQVTADSALSTHLSLIAAMSVCGVMQLLIYFCGRRVIPVLKLDLLLMRLLGKHALHWNTYLSNQTRALQWK